MLEWTESQVSDELTLHLAATNVGIRFIQFARNQPPPGDRNDENALLADAISQLRAYFRSELRVFQIPLDMHGTPFQLRVWHELETIPYGETRSYAQVAEAIGAPRAVRAVGAANGANPVAIVVPCHRVIGSGGKLTGYGGGLPLKKRLLELEANRSNMKLFREY